jgi:hypothetical protein
MVVEASQERFLVYHELLGRLFDATVPPHRAIAFAFRKLLDFTPREIFNRYGRVPLSQMMEIFMDSYAGEQIRRDDLRTICGPTLALMRVPTGKVLSGKDRLVSPRVLDLPCGETTLSDYQVQTQPGAETATIIHWVETVSRGLKRNLPSIRR